MSRTQPLLQREEADVERVERMHAWTMTLAYRISEAAVAEMMGWSKSDVARWTPTRDKIRRIEGPTCSACGVGAWEAKAHDPCSPPNVVSRAEKRRMDRDARRTKGRVEVDVDGTDEDVQAALAAAVHDRDPVRSVVPLT